MATLEGAVGSEQAPDMAAAQDAAAKTGLRYPGWGIVAAGFVLFFFAYAASSTMPFIYDPVMKEFGWTKTQATLIYTYQSGTGALLALFVIGPAIEKLGLKTVQFLMLASVATGMAAFGLVNGLATYYLAGFLIGVGQGTTLITIKVLVSRWFMRNVGLAGSVAIAGSSLGGMVFPQLVTHFMPEYGWRLTFAAMSIGVYVVCLPLCLFLKMDPSEEDVLPEALPTAKGANAAEVLRQADLDMTFRQVLRSPMFLTIMAGIILIAAVDQGLFQHTVLYLTHDAKLSPTLVASAVSLTFTIGFLAKFVAGSFFDRLSMKGVAFWYFLVAIATALVFPIQGFLSVMVFAVARGLVHGGLVSESPVIAKHVYGPKLMNRVLPVLNGFFALGSSIGPVLLALIADKFGYKTGFLVFTIIPCVAALLIWQVTPLYRNRLRAAVGL